MYSTPDYEFLFKEFSTHLQSTKSLEETTAGELIFAELNIKNRDLQVNGRESNKGSHQDHNLSNSYHVNGDSSKIIDNSISNDALKCVPYETDCDILKNNENVKGSLGNSIVHENQEDCDSGAISQSLPKDESPAEWLSSETKVSDHSENVSLNRKPVVNISKDMPISNCADNSELCKSEHSSTSPITLGSCEDEIQIHNQDLNVDEKRVEEISKTDADFASIPLDSITETQQSHTDTDFESPYQVCSAAGYDLLGLYMKQKYCDCCLSVEGVLFLVHKCILSARSPFFNAMFGGQWSESQLQVVNLEGVSANAMEKILLFIYGGVIDVISPSDLLDLFIISDMYGVETMKLALQFFIRKDICHFFHKPCSICTSKTPEALSLCHTFHLEDLQNRILKWMSKQFTKFWCTKTFASYPEALHQLCLNYMVEQMTKTNVLDIIMDCDQLTTSLPRIKWTESVLCLTTQLMDLAIEFTSTNFIEVIHTPEFLTWAKVASWKASALEEIFNSVIDSLQVDAAISVYQTLLDLKTHETTQELPEQNLIDLLVTMIKRCEKFLRTHIHLVTRSKQWSCINKSFQNQILAVSSYIYLDQFPDPKPKPKKPVMYSTLRPQKTAPLTRVSSSSASTSASSNHCATKRGQTSSRSTSAKDKISLKSGGMMNTPLKTTTKTLVQNRLSATTDFNSKNNITSRPLSQKSSSASKTASKPHIDFSSGQRMTTTARSNAWDNTARNNQTVTNQPAASAEITSITVGTLTTKTPNKKQSSSRGQSPNSKLPVSVKSCTKGINHKSDNARTGALHHQKSALVTNSDQICSQDDLLPKGKPSEQKNLLPKEKSLERVAAFASLSETSEDMGQCQPNDKPELGGEDGPYKKLTKPAAEDLTLNDYENDTCDLKSQEMLLGLESKEDQESESLEGYACANINDDIEIYNNPNHSSKVNSSFYHEDSCKNACGNLDYIKSELAHNEDQYSHHSEQNSKDNIGPIIQSLNVTDVINVCTNQPVKIAFVMPSNDED